MLGVPVIREVSPVYPETMELAGERTPMATSLVMSDLGAIACHYGVECTAETLCGLA